MASRPAARHYAVAAALKDGCSARKACIKAGYAETTANRRARKIANSERVKQALLELGATIKPGEIGNISRVRLQEQLLNPPESARDRISAIRLGLEADTVIGKEQLHLHQHNFPPAVIEILERQLAKLRLEATSDAGAQLPAVQDASAQE